VLLVVFLVRRALVSVLVLVLVMLVLVLVIVMVVLVFVMVLVMVAHRYHRQFPAVVSRRLLLPQCCPCKLFGCFFE
jgi:hypothetical protein